MRASEAAAEAASHLQSAFTAHEQAVGQAGGQPAASTAATLAALQERLRVAQRALDHVKTLARALWRAASPDRGSPPPGKAHTCQGPWCAAAGAF